MADNTLILCRSASLPDAEQHMKISKRQNCSIYSHFTQYPFSSLGYINPEQQFFFWHSQACEQTKPEGKSELTPLAL